jgi:hypothetical protein
MPPKSTVRPQRTRGASAARLDIAQGKAPFSRCKQPVTQANASQASATAPPPPFPAQRESRHQPPDPDTASAASTRAKRATTRSAASKSNTASASSSSAKGITSLSPAAGEGATGPNRGVEDSVDTGCAEGESAATHSAEAEGNAPFQFLDYEYGVGN